MEPTVYRFDGDVPLAKKGAQLLWLGRVDDYDGLIASDHRLDGLCGDELSSPDDNEVRREHGQFGDLVAGYEDRSLAGGEGGQIRSEPTDAVGVETVRRLIENEHPGVSERRSGEGQLIRRLVPGGEDRCT